MGRVNFLFVRALACPPSQPAFSRPDTEASRSVFTFGLKLLLHLRPLNSCRAGGRGPPGNQPQRRSRRRADHPPEPGINFAGDLTLCHRHFNQRRADLSFAADFRSNLSLLPLSCLLNGPELARRWRHESADYSGFPVQRSGALSHGRRFVLLRTPYGMLKFRKAVQLS